MTSCYFEVRAFKKKDLDEYRKRAKFTKPIMATNASLKALRDQMVLSYAENVIDSDQLILLYDANMSKDIYPYWKYSHFDMRTFDDE